MINSLRPLLTDRPAVLQQKWHWEHLSMLPDNAHKREICQTQYVNNHNCTGWGHVQANPTEMLLDDCGVSRFQRWDSLQIHPWEKEWEKLRGWQEAVVLHAKKMTCITNVCALLPWRKASVLMAIIIILSLLIERILKKVLLKTCTGLVEDVGQKKARFKV